MIKLIDIPIGNNAPHIVNAIVEIPKDTSAKYEYDKPTNLFRLDRCLISSMRYPVSYGFIPQTLSEDGDPLDILIYSSIPIERGTLVECKIVGCMNMIDSGIHDYKVLGIPLYNPNNYHDITDIDSIFLHVCEDFFRNYKNLENKVVSVSGWINRDQTIKVILDAKLKYDNTR